MSEDKFHLQIPKNNIRNEEYKKTSGGKTIQRNNYHEHGLKLKTETNTLFEAESHKKDSAYSDSVYLQIETPSDISIKSQKQRIESLGFELLSYSSINKSIGIASLKKNKVESFKEKLSEYIETPDNIRKSYFGPIEKISSIPAENKIKTDIDMNSEIEISIVINLYNKITEKEKGPIISSILLEIKNFYTKARYKTFSNGVTSIECKIKPSNIIYLVKQYSTIKEIKANQIFFTETAVVVESLPNPLRIDKVESESMIGIIDSGISPSNTALNSLVKIREFHLRDDCEPHYVHGTFVASRGVFGDKIDSCLSTHQLKPYCNILDVSVIGVDKDNNIINPKEYDLRIALEDVIQKYSDSIKVYNLSIGSSEPVSDYEFSETAKLLDFLSKENKVLFIIAAGNIDIQLGKFPYDHFNNYRARIGCPAESLLGLTVGAVAKFTNVDALSEKDFISPFSRIGPGSDLGIKPEIVAHGGNLISPYNLGLRISTYGLSVDGKSLSTDNGTSYSAPLITQYAQRLFDLYPNSDPNLVKGLLCHFCDERRIHNELGDNLKKYIGFGEPNLQSAIAAGKHNAAYIYEGKLDQMRYQYISFHIPKSFNANQMQSKLKLKITITFDPPVSPDNDSEYSNARIAAQLLKPKNSTMKPIDITKSYNLPWNPIIQFEKSFTKSYEAGRWELRLRLYCRGSLPESYLQDYSVVIEIIDEKKRIDVYSDILSEYSNLYKKIELRFVA